MEEGKLMEWTPEEVQLVEKSWITPAEVELRKAYADIVCSISPGTILEVGCGTGEVYRKMASFIQAGCYNGADISQAMLNRFKELSPEVATFLADGRKLPFEDKSFGTVMAFEVLCHLPMKEVVSVIREMIRVAELRVVFTLDMASSNHTGRNDEFTDVDGTPTNARPRMAWSVGDIWDAICEAMGDKIYHVEVRTITGSKWLYVIDKSQEKDNRSLIILPYEMYTAKLSHRLDLLSIVAAKARSDLMSGLERVFE
jgi:SAM-dependent methyltransferase